MRVLWNKFKKFSVLVARFQSTIILSIVYVLFIPLMLVLTGFIQKEKSGWQPWHVKNDTIDELRMEG